MSDMKALYDAGKAAIVLGVGYPNPTSRTSSMDIWGSANTNEAWAVLAWQVRGPELLGPVGTFGCQYRRLTS